MRTAAFAVWCVWLVGAASGFSSSVCPESTDPQHASGDLPAVVDGWIACGVEAQQAGRYADAKAAFDQAREIADRSGDRKRIAQALEHSGEIRQFLGDLAAAEPMLQKSLQIREEIADQTGIADSLAALGRYYITAGDDLKTREYSERSLELNRELGNRLGVAIALNNIGVSWKSRDVLIALDYFEKSMDELSRAGDERRANVVRNNIANVYYQLGDLDHAIELSQTVLATWDRIGAGERAGVAETSLGIEYLELGDYRTALRFLERSLAVRLKQGYTFGVAEAWNNVALVYRAQGDYGQAQAALEKSIALTRKLENRDLQAEGLANLGEVQYLAGKPAEAAESLRSSLAIAKKLDAKLKIAFATYNLGRLYLSEHNFDQARAFLNQSLNTEEQIHDGLEEGQTLVALAELERTHGDLPRSREFATRALALGEQTGQPEVQWTALTELGRTEAALGSRGQARDAFDRAITVVENLRTRVAGDPTQRAIFFASKTAPYQERMKLSLEAGNFTEAFYYSERTRARALLDTIDGRRPPLSKTMTPEERAEERRLRLELNAVSLQLQSEQGTAVILRKRENQARLNYDAFQTRLYANHPDLRIARARIPTIDVVQARALLSSPSAALLEFAVTPEHTWLFVITSEGLHCFALKTSSSALGRRVDAFRQELAHRDLRVDEAAGQLYKLLLEPEGSLLTGKTEWIIAPDGPLWNLPFQALESKPGRYVIEDAALSYAPSFAVLQEEMRTAARRRTRPPTLLAFGDPEGRTPLPDAAHQVQAVAALYPPSSHAYTGADATEERWKCESPRYRILQFATHAVFDDRSPLYSSIALAEPPSGGSEDGLLEAWEIMQLDLNAELTVLSACETARGGVTPGEGLIGLTWALFVAGSPSSLVTQWKVDAASTSELIIEFHRAWRGGANGISKAKALRLAQLHVLRKQGSDPFDWAAVMLVGDGR